MIYTTINVHQRFASCKYVFLFCCHVCYYVARFNTIRTILVYLNPVGEISLIFYFEESVTYQFILVTVHEIKQNTKHTLLVCKVDLFTGVHRFNAIIA